MAVIGATLSNPQPHAASSASDHGGSRHEGKSCRVCSDQPNTLRGMMDMYRAFATEPASTGSAAAAATAAAAAAGTDDENDAEAAAPAAPQPCPASYKELGNSTWLYLHTMAAYYPENPDPALEASMGPFLDTFARVYPCESCRDHMIGYVAEHPPRASSNETLSVWLCEFHNAVNARLGKPPQKCDARALLQRWRDGPDDGSCD